MKQGFILIEVLLAAAIASIIGIALFASLYQINKMAQVVDTYADVWTKASIAHRQIEKDLLGTCIPIAAQPMNDKKKEQASEGKEKKEQEANESKKEPVKLITHVFYGINKESLFDTLTFITNNPMQVYWGAKAGKAKPRIARVVYRLVKDKNEKNSFTLMRQEGYDLYFDAYKEGDSKGIRQYPMIDGIKQMAVSYGVIEKEGGTDKEGEKSKEKKPEKIKYKILKEWKKEDKGEQKKEEGKENKKKEIELPAFVLIKLNLWDLQKKRDVYFEFKIPLIAQGKPAPVPVQSAPALPATKPQTPPALQGALDTSGLVVPIPIMPKLPNQGTQNPVAPLPAGIKNPEMPVVARGFVFPVPIPHHEGVGLFTNLETGNVEFTDANKLLDHLKPHEGTHAS